ncbi:MAG: ATP-grasp domain-containing protein [Planctomycetota bacterium]
MKVFVGEYVCGGGLVSQSEDDVPAGLLAEGAAMLSALVSDLAEFAETVVSVDPRLAPPINAAHLVEISQTSPLWGQWVAAATGCDAALIVAPESDGVLAQSVAMLRAGGIDVVASSGDFLRTASDKLKTAKVLHSAGVAHPLYCATSDLRFESDLLEYQQFVVKPRDGCGTQQILKYDSYAEARSAMTDEMILQPWMPGNAVSISLIASRSGQTFLPAVSQSISGKALTYEGGRGPLDEDTQRRATSLASRAISVMPPKARGFVGLDVLIGERPSEDFVIEINPRLTTSYVGLRRMIQGNLAARLFDLETGPVCCIASEQSVRWTPGGEVWVDDAVAS